VLIKGLNFSKARRQNKNNYSASVLTGPMDPQSAARWEHLVEAFLREYSIRRYK